MKRPAKRPLIACITGSACIASIAAAQGLDLDPKTPPVTQWTCIAAASAPDANAFDKLATRVLQSTSANDDELAFRFVTAMSLRKIAVDSAYETLSAQRKAEIQAAVDTIDGVQIERIAELLRDVVKSEIADSTPWFVPRTTVRRFAELSKFLESISVEAAEALRNCEAASSAGLQDQGEAISAIDVSSIVSLLKSPESVLPSRTRERVLECLALASIEARAGDASRLLMLGEIAAIGPHIRSVKGLSINQVNKAYDTLLKQSPDAPPRATLERLRRIRQLCDHATLQLPTVESLRLAKPLKPAYAQLSPLFRQTQKTIAPVAKRLLDADESMNDPAIMSADDSFVAVLHDFESLSDISVLITRKDERGRDVLREDCKFAASRLLDAVKRIAKAKDDEKEGRIAEFRSLVATLKLALEIPDEVSLRQDQSSEAAESLTRFTAAQREYLQSLSNPRRPPDEQTVRSLQAGAAVLRLRARAQMEEPWVVLSWPGVELTSGGMRVLREGLETHVREMLKTYALGQVDRLSVALREGEQRHAAALVIADLDAVLKRTGIAPGSALDEVSAGEPDVVRVPGAIYVSDFRFISLCAEEIAALRSAGAESKVVEDRMNARAKNIRVDRKP